MFPDLSIAVMMENLLELAICGPRVSGGMAEDLVLRTIHYPYYSFGIQADLGLASSGQGLRSSV